MSRLRRAVGRFTSPVFVPLRRVIVWLDDRYGTCDHRLILEPRACQLDLEQVPAERISELRRKISKDEAEMVYAGLQ